MPKIRGPKRTFRRPFTAEPVRPVPVAIPDLADWYNDCGADHLAAGRFDEGEAAFRRSLEVRPTAAARSNLGAVLLARGRLDEAIAEFRAAIALYPAGHVRKPPSELYVTGELEYNVRVVGLARQIIGAGGSPRTPPRIYTASGWSNRRNPPNGEIATAAIQERTRAMTVSATNPMADLYRRLKSVGLTKAKMHKFILPDWWDDQVAANPAAFAEGISHISRHLGLDLASLRDPGREIAFRDAGVCKFKKSKDTTEGQLQLTRSLATRVAQLVNAATVEPCSPLPKSATQARAEILGQGHPWVGLPNLVDYCWSIGVPVVHLTSFLSTRQPDGLAVKVRGRPVIVLCKKAKAPAWLLFILAHELGHIVLGHIPDNGALIDEDVDTNERDDEEVAANQFAVELLTGEKETRFRAGGRWPNADTLAKRAKEIGRAQKTDPGHIVLNYAHTMGSEFFPVANAALGKLETAEAMGVVRRKLAQHLDWSRLPEDSSEFLMRVSQAEKTSDLPFGQRHRREAGDL